MGDYERMNTNFVPQNAAEDDSLWDMLSVYADGEATPGEAAQMEALLRSDSALKREFDFMRMASAFAASEPEIAPPAELRDRIDAATVARPTLRRRMAIGWADLAASLTPRYAMAGGLAGAALLTVALWPHNNKVETPKVAAQTNRAALQVAVNPPPAPLETRPVAVPPTATETVKIAPKEAQKPILKTAALPAASNAVGKKPQQIADANAAPNKAPTLTATHPKSAPNPARTVKSPQTPSSVEPSEPTMVVYAPTPDMDRNNQRPHPAAEAPDENLTLPDDKSADTPAPPRPTVTAIADAMPKPGRWESRRVGLSDNARQMTPSAMRQQQQARNGGYNPLNISSIKQNQIRLETELRF